MMHWKRTGPIFAAAFLLASGLVLTEARDAEARGRGRWPVFVGGFYGPYYGNGFGPWGWGPWAGPWYGYSSGPSADTMAIAKMTGWGAVQLNAKPSEADVWVDGKYVAEARELDGSPSYLWLEKGPHRLAVYKGGYKTFDEEIAVERGTLKQLKVRLEKGESVPPGPKPDKKGSGDKGSSDKGSSDKGSSDKGSSDKGRDSKTDTQTY